MNALQKALVTWRARRARRRSMPAETVKGIRVIRYPATGSDWRERQAAGPGLRPPEIRS
jgi:hypothetical protein